MKIFPFLYLYICSYIFPLKSHFSSAIIKPKQTGAFTNQDRKMSNVRVPALRLMKVVTAVQTLSGVLYKIWF